MANSSIIGRAKNRIIKDFIKDIDIIQAIGDENVTSVENGEDLIGTRIFGYGQNPNTINEVGTFIMILVHIPNAITSTYTFVIKAGTKVSDIITFYIRSGNARYTGAYSIKQLLQQPTINLN